ncbi:MAG: glycogen debranching protein, partial [Lacisediminihabitans sp.]
MPPRTGVQFDITEIPFSAKGSWLDLSPVVGLHERANDVHLVTHTTGMHGILRLVPERSGQCVATTNAATPASLRWLDDEGGEIEAVFDGLETIRIRGRGLALRLIDASALLASFSGTYFFRDPMDGSAVFTSYESGRRYRVTSIMGELQLEGSEALGDSVRAVVASGDSGWEIAVEEFEVARAPYVGADDFDTLRTRSATAFDDYLELTAAWRGTDDHVSERA